MTALARIFAAIARALQGGWSFLSDALDEAIEPVTRRLPWLRDRARAAGHIAGQGASIAADAAAVTAEVALKAPGAIGREVGSVIGSMLPAPAVTGRALAEGAIVSDEEIQRMMDEAGVTDIPHCPHINFGDMLQWALKDYRDGGEKALARHMACVSESAADWIRSLSYAETETALSLAPDALLRHSLPEKPSDVCPLLPPVVSVAPAPKPKPSASLVSKEEFAAMVAQSKRNARAIGPAVAEAMKQVPSVAPSRPEPRFDATADDAPVYGRGYRPRSAY
ncbi:MAG: hypothetical protein MIN69_00225 [Methylorubrum extorquens]|jgi:hypothetical protein|uniref:hypothetical protein n=1 Tax=Methylorubrum extorquens TaxID=408 RepID=UPI002FEDED2E